MPISLTFVLHFQLLLAPFDESLQNFGFTRLEITEKYTFSFKQIDIQFIFLKSIGYTDLCKVTFHDTDERVPVHLGQEVDV